MELVALIIFLQLVLEAFPISSSGHVILISQFLGSVQSLPKYFDHFLFGPWALVLIVFFFSEWRSRIWWFLPKSLMSQKFKQHAKKLNAIAYKIFLYAFIANIMTGALYFIFKLNKPESSIFIIIGMVITGALLFSLFFKKDVVNEGLDFKKAIILGCVQGLSLLPGISRFGSTYVIARHLNLSTRRAFQASFLIQMPVCMAAFVKGFFEVRKYLPSLFTNQVWIAFIVGTILSCIGLWFSYKVAMKKRIWIFGIYMLMPILVALIMFVS